MALTQNPYVKILPQPANIQGFWRMEEESGTRADLSDNGNTLQDNNTVLFDTGIIGNAADFELDTGEWLSITDGLQTGLDITGDLSVAFWINPESAPASYMELISKTLSAPNISWTIYLHGTTRILYFLVSEDGTNYKVVDFDNVVTCDGSIWVHVIATFNATTGDAMLYRDGLHDETTATGYSGLHDTPAPFCIGARGASRYYDGLADEPIVWDKVLTPAEVLQVKNITSYEVAVAGGFSGFSPWIFMKDMWEKHNKIWKPKGVLIPERI